jgi:hypothetical protein
LQYGSVVPVWALNLETVIGNSDKITAGHSNSSSRVVLVTGTSLAI